MIKNRLIWLNGELVPAQEAKINVLSPTSQFGANVFEGIRCYWSNSDNQLYAFRLEDHIDRLQRSIRMIRFDSKYSNSDLHKAFIDTVTANNYREDIAVRQTVFLDGIGSWFATGPVNMFIAPIAKARTNFSSLKGIKCCVSSWERINDNSLSPKVKVGANYINSRAAQLEALQNNYDSAIFLNHTGKISEGPGSCLFIVRNGKLITPSLSSSILESITRETIIELAKTELGLDVIEREIDRTELYISEEAFLCGSAVEITPITNIDGFLLKSLEKESLTHKLHTLYLQAVTGELKQYNHWLTKIY